jgi:hypothetical protein
MVVLVTFGPSPQPSPKGRGSKKVHAGGTDLIGARIVSPA